MIAVQRSSSARPVGVRTTSRMARWNSLVPSSVSSLAINRLTFDFGMPNARAAHEKAIERSDFLEHPQGVEIEHGSSSHVLEQCVH
jgi:hypothetical protein